MWVTSVSARLTLFWRDVPGSFQDTLAQAYLHTLPASRTAKPEAAKAPTVTMRTSSPYVHVFTRCRSRSKDLLTLFAWHAVYAGCPPRV